MYNFIEFNMLTPKNWNKVLRDFEIHQFCELYSPELFFFLFPLILDEYAFPKFIVARYIRINESVRLEPIGLIDHFGHPAVENADEEQVPDCYQNLFCLTVGRMSCNGICFSGVLHSLNWYEEEVGESMPTDLDEAGMNFFEIASDFCEFEPIPEYLFVRGGGRESMTTQIDPRKYPNPFTSTVPANRNRE